MAASPVYMEDMGNLPVRHSCCDTCNYRPDTGFEMGAYNNITRSEQQAGWKKRELLDLPIHKCHTNPTLFMCFGSCHNRTMSRNKISRIIEKRMGL